jgi:hypothetical protein
VGLIKQLGRLEEHQALEAIANYREAASRRGGKSILNPSAYFMVILREFIEVSGCDHALACSIVIFAAVAWPLPLCCIEPHGPGAVVACCTT